ncbi:hypothetical protein FW796_10405 [Pseudomonas sp. 910_21]
MNRYWPCANSWRPSTKNRSSCSDPACRNWLASEGPHALAFAGKPAPTRIRLDTTLTVGAGLPAKRPVRSHCPQALPHRNRQRKSQDRSRQLSLQSGLC